jgi:hypothetical protein
VRNILPYLPEAEGTGVDPVPLQFQNELTHHVSHPSNQGPTRGIKLHITVGRGYIPDRMEVGKGRLEEERMRTTAFHHLRTLALVMATLALSACAGASMQGYSGSALPADQTAIVKSGAYTDLMASDGMKVPRLSVAVLPGRHTIVMKPSDNQGLYGYGAYFYYSLVTGSVQFTAEAGHYYLAYVIFAPASGTTWEDDMEHTGTGFTWVGYITDETTGKRVARTDRLALQAEPRGWPGGVSMMRR